ncbi:unnamed protein product [Prorocentrum cordatum]|uniref:Uncharacterized protein n=1 Tax=Prorocentrum cordatum TaxID=2364126 RepID=A0ABN9XLE4_9DINO|nr:unnamed protein product [Polarella glacialis]
MNVAKEYAADKNETKWLKSESTDRYTMDPEVRRFYEQNSERQDDLNHVKATELLMIDICDFARKSGASHCHWKLEGEEALVMPEDQAHHNVMMYYNPLETAAGKAVLYKWRSTGVLWDKAKAREEQFGEYSVVVVARDDDYWIGPYYINAVDFLDNPSLTRVIPCLESHGINDKAVIMGRKSADALLTTYGVWWILIGRASSGMSCWEPGTPRSSGSRRRGRMRHPSPPGSHAHGRRVLHVQRHPLLPEAELQPLRARRLRAVLRREQQAQAAHQVLPRVQLRRAEASVL